MGAGRVLSGMKMRIGGVRKSTMTWQGTDGDKTRIDNKDGN